MTSSNAVALLLLVSALIACTGFIGMYASFSPWRVNPAGKTMMLLAGSLAWLIISGILLNLFGPDYPGRNAVRIGAYVALNIALWRQLLLLVRVQNSDFQSKAAAERAEADLPPVPRARSRKGPSTGEIQAQDKTPIL